MDRQDRNHRPRLEGSRSTRPSAEGAGRRPPKARPRYPWARKDASEHRHAWMQYPSARELRWR